MYDTLYSDDAYGYIVPLNDLEQIRSYVQDKRKFTDVCMAMYMTFTHVYLKV